MALLKTLWFGFSLAVTLAFLAFVSMPCYLLTRLIWRGTGLDAQTVRRMHSAFMFAWANSAFGIFCKLMRIMPHRVGGRDRQSWFQPAIVVANHQSTLDIMVLMWLLPDIGCQDARWVLKDALGKIPLIGHVCRGNGSAFIDRKDRQQAKRAIADASSLAHADKASIFLFPEGTRKKVAGETPAPDGGTPFRYVLPPKPGGFLALRKAMPDHDILVVTIDYGGMPGITTIYQLGRLFGRTIAVRAERHRAPNADAAWLNARWREMDYVLD